MNGDTDLNSAPSIIDVSIDADINIRRNNNCD